MSQSGAETNATTEFSLTSSSVFDLTQADNILHKFNSINGGVVIPSAYSKQVNLWCENVGFD